MSNRTRVLSNSFLYTVSSLLIKSISFILLPVYTIYMSPEEYGSFNLLMSFNQVMIFVVAVSMYAAIVRFYADFNNDKETLKRFYGTIITFVFISGITFTSLGILLKEYLISFIFEGIDFYPMVIITLLTLTFLSLHTVHQNILQGQQEGKKLTIINFIVFTLQVILTLIFVIIFNMGALGMLLPVLIVNVCYVIFMLIDLWKSSLIKFCLDIKLLKMALKYSLPVLPHDLSTHIASFTSRIFLNNSATLSAVGLFSIASQISALIDVIQTSVNKAFAPWFYERMNIKNVESNKDVIQLTNFLLIFYSFIYMGIGIFSPELIILFTAEDYHLAWTIIPILVAGFSIKSIYYFYINILFFNKKATKKIFYATLSSSMVDIILAYFLIPIYGMTGAAVSFFMAKIIMVTLVVFISKKYNDIGYRASSMLKIIVPSLIAMGAGLILSYTKYPLELNGWNFFYKIGVLALYTAYIYGMNIEVINKILLSLKLKYFASKDNKSE